MFANRARRLPWLAPSVLAAILLLALALRLWRIDTLPPGFHFDESFEGLEAWRILTEPAYRPVFLAGNFGVTPLNAYANAAMFGLWQWLGGIPGPTAMRVTAALVGTLGVLAIYGLAAELRRLDPQRLTPALPLLAAAVMATLRWHIHFSRMGIEPIFVPLFWTAATWLLLRGWRTGGWAAFAFCGALLAAAMYSYQGAWVIPLLMPPVVAHLWLRWRRQDGVRRRLLGTLLAAGVAGLLVLPLALFFADNLDLLVLRPAQIAVTGAPGAQATDATPWEDAIKSALMFAPLGQTGDMDPRRNLPGAAALNWWQFLPFAGGLLLALWRVRNPAYSTVLIGLVGLLLPGVFSEYAPHFHRILGAAAPTVLLCGIGLDAVVRWGWQRAAPVPHVGVRTGQPSSHPLTRSPAHPLTRWLAAALVAVFLLAGAVGSARDYFVRWAALPDLFYAFDAGLWQLGQVMARQPADEPLYLTPQAADHPTLAFAFQTQAGSHPAPNSFDGRLVFPLTAGANPQPEHYFVIEHEDFRTRLLLPEVLPDATVAAELYDDAGGLYARQYVRPAGAIPQRPPQHLLADADTNLLGDGIRLLGYDVQGALAAGEVLYLQLHWLVEQPPSQEWTVFTHLLQPDGQGGYRQVAGRDAQPGGGSLPTSAWQQGWRVLDEYQLLLPGDLPAGAYTLAVGLYGPGDGGARLPATGPGLLVGEVTIE